MTSGSSDMRKAGRSSNQALETVLIGLGGNVGDVETSMREALALLDDNRQIEVIAKSALYRTPPWGDENQDWFLNACAQLQTNLTPLKLLDTLKKAEKALKREKTRRWGPRTIDLDILFFGDLFFSDERLEIPHPRMKDRAFVLLPLRDLAPDREIEGHRLETWIRKLNIGEISVFKQATDW